MSTGQRQRVKLAAAFVHDPALVLLDEPTNGLDPIQREEVLALVRRIGTEFGIDVVLSSHLLEEVERVCDAAVILAEGQVVAAGPLAALRSGGEALLVEVDAGTDELAARLAAGGLHVEAEGRRLVITGPADASSDAVRDAVVALGLGLRRLQRRTASLEDVFLDFADAPARPSRP